MLYKASYFEPLGETRIELVANTHSDSWPMLRRLNFRKMPIDLATQSVPLATAILTHAYCGDVFEFAGLKIGSDYADAIRALLPAQANVINVDGFNRSFSTGEVEYRREPGRQGRDLGAACRQRAAGAGRLVGRFRRCRDAQFRRLRLRCRADQCRLVRRSVLGLGRGRPALRA